MATAPGLEFRDGNRRARPLRRAQYRTTIGRQAEQAGVVAATELPNAQAAIKTGPARNSSLEAVSAISQQSFVVRVSFAEITA